MPDESVKIELNSDEALVLFEFLSRYSDTDSLTVEDQAEQVVLWKLCCCLERELVEPFQKNYGELLSNARNAVRHEEIVDLPTVTYEPDSQGKY
ncbi:hypothetical protein BH20ACI2_BH20ACI2_26690 [soil metagenome]